MHSKVAAWGLAGFALGTPAVGSAEPAPARVQEVGVGLTAGAGDGGEVGSLTAGLDAWYRPSEWFAGGLELQGLYFDNMEYCTRCISGGGLLAVAFAEGRAFPRSTVSGFVRFGLGAGRWNYIDENYRSSGERLHTLALLAVGPQVTVWRVFFRLRGVATIAPPKSFLGYGVELGGLFGN